MTDFLLELRSEEIPARMQAKAREDLARLFAAELAKAGLQASAITTYATPRRLALIARDLPDATEAVAEEVKGPKTSAPPQALEGFLRKTNLTRDQLVDRNGTLFAITEKPGRATAEVLAEAIPAVIRAFPWPKSMRWGAASTSTESLRWVRPLQGIVAIFGEELVPVDIAGTTSGYATVGHRFHHPGIITIGSANDYVEKLRACHVIVDQDERAALIRTCAQDLAAEAGLELVEDEGLVAENAGLTEWPVPLLGRFDEAFLAVPPEVIQLTARVNQKYFVCRVPLPLAGGVRGGPVDGAADMPSPNPSRAREGSLANAFICTANIDATDGGATIVEGNRKVLAARLSDAKFFYDTDLKVPLAEQAKKLDKIVFHEKLGTVADKVERVAKLARWLCEEGIVTPKSSPTGGGGPRPQGVVEGERPQSMALAAIPLHHQPAAGGPPPPAGEDLGDLAERAARLCKADLVTGMVGEFPELQGLMGGYYALAQGEDPQVAGAIRDHYKPVGQGDEVPTAPVTVAVSLADKLDVLASFFSVNERPTGSKDPYALRRAGIALNTLIVKNDLRMFLAAVFSPPVYKRVQHYAETTQFGDYLFNFASDHEQSTWENGGRRIVAARHAREEVVPAILDFLADRLKVQQREAGVRHDLIDAVFALGGEDDLVRLLARTHALQAFVETEDGANLLAGYKRAANILKKEGYTQPADNRHPGLVPGSSAGSAPQPASEAWTPEQVRGDEGATAASNALSYTPEPCEAALIAALDSAEPAAASAVVHEDFEGAMAALASLRAPIDSFFDSVTVNDPDPDKRESRLRLLARVRAAVHTVADFSRIEG